jgi:hypothetical protein
MRFGTKLRHISHLYISSSFANRVKYVRCRLRGKLYSFRQSLSKDDFRKEPSIFLLTLIFSNVLTYLQFALKFVCPFIIREGAFLGDEVENLLLITVVADLSSNQLAVPNYTSHVWPTLKEKIPLVFNFAVHLFLLPET